MSSGKYYHTAGVQTIGFMAFTDCDELVPSNIAGVLDQIDNYAFSTCKKLEQINLPPNLSYIGYRAFEFCDGLKTIQLPNKLATMGEAFPWMHAGTVSASEAT
ncbi:MAG: leucine-rich repeat domain-containing protein [Eubacteriales bacterium]